MRAYLGFMTFDAGTPDTELSDETGNEADDESSQTETPQEGSSWTDALPDGSGSDADADTDADTASGGPAD